MVIVRVVGVGRKVRVRVRVVEGEEVRACRIVSSVVVVWWFMVEVSSSRLRDGVGLEIETSSPAAAKVVFSSLSKACVDST